MPHLCLAYPHWEWVLAGGRGNLPGVQIGEGTVIGAGSVVTKDIPENVLAMGNPCRMLRPINQDGFGKACRF